jgi:hypothetical protein
VREQARVAETMELPRHIIDIVERRWEAKLKKTPVCGGKSED